MVEGNANESWVSGPGGPAGQLDASERLAKLCARLGTETSAGVAADLLCVAMDICGGDCAAWFSAFYDDEDAPGEWRGSMEADVSAEGSPRLKRDPGAGYFAWAGKGLQGWASGAERGALIFGDRTGTPLADFGCLLEDQLGWIAAAPITTIRGWSGCILVGARGGQAPPSQQSLAALQIAASLFGAAASRTELETTLAETRTHLDNILRYSSEYAIAVTDLHSRVQLLNPTAEEMFSLPADQIIGHRIPDSVLAKPLGLDSLQEAEAAVKAGGSWESEIEIPAADGQERSRHINLVVSGIYLRNPHSGQQGPLSGYLIIARDVSDQRQRERRILESQRMESVGLLAGGIAHDFNNILMGILGYASLAKDILGQGHEAFRMVNTIEQSAERAAALTNQLLAYARGGKLQTVAVDMELLITEMLNIIGSNIPKTTVIEREQCERLPSVMADPSQIQQVIMNLCLNASEAIVERLRQQPSSLQRASIRLKTGITHLEKAPPNTVHADDFKPSGDFVFLRVEDDGCGMDEVTKKRIFEPFFTTKFTGRGLGLAAVQGIVRNHGGALAVDSEIGTGTVFTVYLPSTEALPMDPGLSEALLPLGGDETILIIDDEEVARQLGVLTLANLGYHVLIAADGQQGLEVYHQHMDEISLVLLDLTMPGLGGTEVLAELALLPRKVPVILSSGYDEATLDTAAQGRYLSGFLQKPYTPEVLARAVREILNRHSKQG